MAKGLSGGLKGNVNLFNLMEKALEDAKGKLDKNGQQRVVKFETEINISGVNYKTLEVSRYQQTIKWNSVKYRIIELFADEFSKEHILQIKVYSNGKIEAYAQKP